MKTALITGVTGQDGSYLARLLLDKGYKVWATYRRSSAPNFWRLRELGLLEEPNFALVENDLTDFGNITRTIEKTEPDELYNLAAQSFVGSSFGQPETTAQITGLGALRLLEAIRMVNPAIRFYQASTSEMFGKAQTVPQNEQTPFYPRSPYGAAKLYAHWMSVNYRESYGIFTCNGILFNHESPLRGEEFVTRKITSTLARIALGKDECLELGNMDARRDWGYAPEYVEGMWRMLQRDEPDDYVLATGCARSVREFVELAAQCAGMNIEWRGSGVDETGIDSASGKTIVRVNPQFYRPADVQLLLGDAGKAHAKLGWQAITSLPEIAQKMYAKDFERAQHEASQTGCGIK